jgi:uncharacterized protein (TIGR02001 family)
MKTQASLLLSTLVLSGAALAQSPAPKAPDPEFTASFNVGVVTDYRYRGLSQSRLSPAAQAGADIGHKSGLYFGLWASSIRWIKDNDVKGPVEVDIYAGYKGTAGDLGYDIGVLRYDYVGNKLASVPGAVNANTNEFYLAGTLGVATLKYSRSFSNLFGFPDSKGSYYVDGSATIDLGQGFALVPHVGYQSVAGRTIANYTDYSLTLTKDLGNGLSASLMVVGTDADKTVYYSPKTGSFTGKTGAVAGLKFVF